MTYGGNSKHTLTSNCQEPGLNGSLPSRHTHSLTLRQEHFPPHRSSRPLEEEEEEERRLYPGGVPRSGDEEARRSSQHKPFPAEVDYNDITLALQKRHVANHRDLDLPSTAGDETKTADDDNLSMIAEPRSRTTSMWSGQYKPGLPRPDCENTPPEGLAYCSEMEEDMTPIKMHQSPSLNDDTSPSSQNDDTSPSSQPLSLGAESYYYPDIPSKNFTLPWIPAVCTPLEESPAHPSHFTVKASLHEASSFVPFSISVLISSLDAKLVSAYINILTFRIRTSHGILIASVEYWCAFC